MPQRRIESPPIYGSSLPMPSDIESNPIYKEVCTEYYNFWIEALDNGWIGEELVVRGNNFFEKVNESAAKWLEGEDLKFRKTRAVLVKEKAYQDWDRVHRGKRRKSPSVYFPTLS